MPFQHSVRLGVDVFKPSAGGKRRLAAFEEVCRLQRFGRQLKWGRVLAVPCTLRLARARREKIKRQLHTSTQADLQRTNP
jgi:hypothetical protein